MQRDDRLLCSGAPAHEQEQHESDDQGDSHGYWPLHVDLLLAREGILAYLRSKFKGGGAYTCTPSRYGRF
ncbi:hypothetical protein KKF05_02985 [Patescibacteria group bacterium]|nr:hypothetical protein [Patescibacteria group bacterium]MBU1028605.1 hypothetical protein [Patescibacteria group bacterium]